MQRGALSWRSRLEELFEVEHAEGRDLERSVKFEDVSGEEPRGLPGAVFDERVAVDGRAGEQDFETSRERAVSEREGRIVRVDGDEDALGCACVASACVALEQQLLVRDHDVAVAAVAERATRGARG